jgi:hypothetical protein
LIAGDLAASAGRDANVATQAAPVSAIRIGRTFIDTSSVLEVPGALTINCFG